MPRHPLCEVFGFPYNNLTAEASYTRSNNLCPFNNHSICIKHGNNVPHLGVCSVWEGEHPVITCPVRLFQDSRVITDTKDFLLPNVHDTDFVSEVTLKDAFDNSVGDLDYVVVKTDAEDNVIDFGGLEVQAVYITGNISEPFLWYIQDPSQKYDQVWMGKKCRPDWLSSVKRLVHQLRAKGVVFTTWEKHLAIAVQKHFYESFSLFSTIPQAPKEDADLAWFFYDLVLNPQDNRYNLVLEQTIYMKFEDAMEMLGKLQAGNISKFLNVLTRKLRAKKLRKGHQRSI